MRQTQCRKPCPFGIYCWVYPFLFLADVSQYSTYLKHDPPSRTRALPSPQEALSVDTLFGEKSETVLFYSSPDFSWPCTSFIAIGSNYSIIRGLSLQHTWTKPVFFWPSLGGIGAHDHKILERRLTGPRGCQYIHVRIPLCLSNNYPVCMYVCIYIYMYICTYIYMLSSPPSAYLF